MVKNSAAGLLTSLDDLFSTQEEREIAVQPRVEDSNFCHPFEFLLDFIFGILGGIHVNLLPPFCFSQKEIANILYFLACKEVWDYFNNG